jgi:two-component system sensor kinase FixL
MFAVVRESLALVAHDAVARQVQTACDLPSAPYPVLGDPVLLQHVIVNLVLNAFDAMADTPVEQRRVVVETAMGSASVDILVRDFGRGCPRSWRGACSSPS